MSRLKPRFSDRDTDGLVLTAVLVGLWSRTMFAYIDPGAGSAAYQVVLTALLSIGYGIRRLVRGQSFMNVLRRLSKAFRPDESG